jgi:uncharacterized membrane protein YczE/cytidylate kinase
MRGNLLTRWIVFIIGLFVMALGVALSVKANLGVSPISCIPYIYSVQFPLTMGETTIIFNVILILLQIVVKRRNYQLFQLIQFPVVIVFGYFIDFTLYLVQGLHPEGYILQMFFCLLGCLVMGFGVFLEVKAKATYLAGEGLAMAISETFGIEFGKAKISVDCSMVICGIISSLVLLHALLGIREGTVIAAVLVGFIARVLSRNLPFVDTWLGNATAADTEPTPEATTGKHPLVITISREFGSGGRDIGKLVAQKLGVSFYDKDIIKLTAEKSGFTPEYIQEHEQRLAHSLLFSLYENYAYVDEQKPPLDALFLTQSKIIREISEKEPCVIVGRCANFVLKGHPNCFTVYVHANDDFRKKRFIEVYGGKAETAKHDLEKIDHDRRNYCHYFTGKERGIAKTYDITVDSSLFGIEKAAQLIVDAITNIR